MGKGIDAAREGAPLHAAVLDDLKDQLLIAFVRRLGKRVDMPCAELDGTDRFVMIFSVDEKRVFHFVLQEKA